MNLVDIEGTTNLAGNFPVLTTTVGVDSALLLDVVLDSVLVVREKYFPDDAGIVTIDLVNILSELQELEVPDSETDIFHQVKGYGVLGLFVSDGVEEPVTYYSVLIRGGVSKAPVNMSTFLQQNFLTWQPQIKKVKQNDQEWLTYYAIAPATVKVKAYFTGSAPVVSNLVDLPGGELNSFNVSYGTIDSLFPIPPTSPVFYDVWVEDIEGVRMSNMQRYGLTKEYFEYEDVFLFENSIGGIDTIRFTGESVKRNEFTISRAVFDKVTKDYKIRKLTVFKKNTGVFRSEEERDWSVEFFISLRKFLQVGSNVVQVYADEIKLESTRYKINNGEFEYAVCLDDQHYSVERETAELAAPHIFPAELPEEPIFTEQFTNQYQ